jgi:hypothetical protein
MSQFSALTATQIQFIFFLILLAYRNWYLSVQQVDVWS